MASSVKRKRKLNKTERARQYFEFLRKENQTEMYTCKLCKKEVNGTRNWNLTSHIERSHDDINQIICQDEEFIEFKRKKLLFDCAEMVSVNGRAFKSLNDSAIIAMNEEVLSSLHCAGRDLNLSDKNLPEVKHLLHIVADQIREKIRIETKGCPLCLMIDIGTSGTRSILGIRIQFISNGKLVLRSIGMIELKQSHTGLYLSSVIVKRLNEFGINCRQIISVTTDNGANVLKTVRDMEKYMQTVDDDAQILPKTPSKKKASEQQNQKENEPISDDDAIDREIEAALALPDEVNEDDAYDILFDESVSDENLEKGNTLLLTIAQELNRQHGINIVWNVAGIPCNAHTLQLGVGDSINETTVENQNVIKLSKKVAKLLRVTSTRRDIESAGIEYKSPRLEVITRWCTDYLMVIKIYIL